MKLTKYILEQISWWELTTETNYNVINDIYTLHFKRWYKRDRRIFIPHRVENIDVDKNLSHHKRTDNSLELEQQLIEYFKDK